jgi:hypothetical protein
VYLDFLHGIAADRIGEVFLGVLEPAVESRRLLGEREVEVLDLSILVLEAEQVLLPTVGVAQQLLPSINRHDHMIHRPSTRKASVPERT